MRDGAHSYAALVTRGAFLLPCRVMSKTIPSSPAAEAAGATVGYAGATCTVVCADSREELKGYEGQVDLIVTSPPYADSRRRHYDSVHPDEFAGWFMTFHEPFWNALKPSGSLVLNIKDKVVNGVRHRYVWHTVEALSAAGWHCV